MKPAQEARLAALEADIEKTGARIEKTGARLEALEKTFALKPPPQLRKTATRPRPQEGPTPELQKAPAATPSGPARPVVYLYDGRVATDAQIEAIARLCDFAAERGQGPTGEELKRRLGLLEVSRR